MRLIAAATLTLLPLAATAAQPQPQPPGDAPPPGVEQQAPGSSAKPRCDRFARVERAGERAVLQAPPARAQRLDELPPGDLRLTVMRSVDGCVDPVIVRQGYGAPTFREEARPRR